MVAADKVRCFPVFTAHDVSANLIRSSERRALVTRPMNGEDAVNSSNHNLKEHDMTATYTWDVFSTLDGYGSYGEGGDWGGYWGKQGPELLAHRAALFDTEQRMVFGATTFREIAADPALRRRPAQPRRVERPDDAHARDRDLLDVARHPRLAGRDDRQR